MTLTGSIKTIAIIGALFSLGVVLFKGDHSSLFMIALGLVFGVWVVAPFALAYVRSPLFSENRIASILMLIGVVAATALSLFAYWMTFIDNPTPDAQDGLIFLFVPLYQLIGLGLVIWAAGWVSKFVK